MGFFSNNGGETYNGCHCKSYSHSLPFAGLKYAYVVWSNFEIADMDFWRGPAYTAFFQYLDATGGFYYEVCIHRPVTRDLLSQLLHFLSRQRWGDAPVHSIAAGLFARKDQIHFFEEIGYQHDDWSHCPIPTNLWETGHCSCNPQQSFGELRLNE